MKKSNKNNHEQEFLEILKNILERDPISQHTNSRDDECWSQIQPHLLDESTFKGNDGASTTLDNSRQILTHKISDGLCPGLMVLICGLAVSENPASSACCLPMPIINRPLTNDRRYNRSCQGNVASVFDPNSDDNIKNQHFDFYPYTIFAGNEQEHDQNVHDCGNHDSKLFGKPRTCGLAKERVEALYIAFSKSNRPLPDINFLNQEKNKLKVVSAVLQIIQQEDGLFGGLQNFDNYRKFHSYLQFLRGANSETQRWNNSSWRHTVLMIKALWVSLGFPILAPVSGMGRLYSANQELLNRTNAHGCLPEAFKHRVPATLVGLMDGTFNKDTKPFLQAYGMEQQYIAQNIAQYTLPELVKLIWCDKEIDIINYTPKPKAYFEAKGAANRICTQQMEKIAEKLKFFASMCSNGKGVLTDGYLKVDDLGRRARLHTSSPFDKIGKECVKRVLFSLGGLVKVDFKDDKIVFQSPHVSINQFFLSDGSGSAPILIPKQLNKENLNTIKAMLAIETCIVSPIVRNLQSWFLPLKPAQPQNCDLGEWMLQEFLFSYMRELVTGYGLFVEYPFVNLELPQVKSLFRSLDPTQMDKNHQLMADWWKKSSGNGQDFKCNLFGVVTYVVLCINLFINEDEKKVKSFNNSRFIKADSDATRRNMLKELCPLFTIPEKSENIKWSLYELSKSLLDGKSDYARKAAEDVNNLMQSSRFSNRNLFETIQEHFKNWRTDIKQNDTLFCDLFNDVASEEVGGTEHEQGDVQYDYLQLLDKDKGDSENSFQELKLDAAKEIKPKIFFSRLPSDKLTAVCEWFTSSEYMETFHKESSKIQWYDWQSRSQPEQCHGQYRMSGQNKSAAETDMMKFIEDKLKEVHDFSVKSSNCGAVCTVNGMAHQFSHVDNPRSFEEGSVGYIGHMALHDEGSLIRLDQTEKSKEGSKIVHFHYVHIPKGYLLLHDARWYHGGHYGSNKLFRFHCYITNFEWNISENPDMFIWPDIYPSTCQPSIDEIGKQFRDATAEVLTEPKKVALWLGMIGTTPKSKNMSTSPNECKSDEEWEAWLQTFGQNNQNILGKQEARDFLRISAALRQGCRVYSTSAMDKRDDMDPTYHYNGNWNKAQFLDRVKEKLHVVEFDCTWMPSSYFDDHVREFFYQKNIPAIMERLVSGGCILLPLQICILDQIIGCANKYPSWSLSLLTGEEVKKKSPLLQATSALRESLDSEQYDIYIGKEKNQEDRYCGIKYQELNEVQISNPALIRTLMEVSSSSGDATKLRYICIEEAGEDMTEQKNYKQKKSARKRKTPSTNTEEKSKNKKRSSRKKKSLQVFKEKVSSQCSFIESQNLQKILCNTYQQDSAMAESALEEIQKATEKAGVEDECARTLLEVQKGDRTKTKEDTAQAILDLVNNGSGPTASRKEFLSDVIGLLQEEVEKMDSHCQE